jgi:hypothetical protein
MLLQQHTPTNRDLLRLDTSLSHAKRCNSRENPCSEGLVSG